MMCNVAFDSGRIVNIKDHQSTSKLTVVIDASTAETFYTAMKPSLRLGMPICIHPNPEARQAFIVKNVTNSIWAHTCSQPLLNKGKLIAFHAEGQ